VIGAWQTRLDAARAEWRGARNVPLHFDRLASVKAEAEAIIDAGLWTSGPDDLLGVLGRRRDELAHSRVIGWLLVPTNRHGLGRRVLQGLLDHVWPGEALLAHGPVIVELEEPRQAADEDGVMRAARADIVVRGETLCLVIENKVDAAEQPDQCERLYWAFADQADDTRYLFLTRTGRPPTTTRSPTATVAWRSIGYRDLRAILTVAIRDAERDAASTGPSSAIQYLATLGHIAPG
jgi:hypothetical protein